MARRAPPWLRDQPIAHRGLHDEAAGVIENTLSAFEAAARADYAIELDIVPSADGEAMVFHDHTLERLTMTSGDVDRLSAADLSALPMKGTSDRIPTLSTLLWLIRGRVPLLIEIKSFSREVGRLEARVAEVLKDYKGDFAVQSFNPLVVEWFRANAPEMIRGQLSMRYTAQDFPTMSALERQVLTNLALTHRSRPDFIAYDASALPAIAPRIARTLGLPVIAWTLRSAEDWKRVSQYADNLIFEGFRAR